jgi:hypothetical protein
MHRHGFHTLYAKVWHNNTPSTKAFVKSGWRNYSFFVRVQPSGLGWPLYLQWPLFARAGARPKRAIKNASHV